MPRYSHALKRDKNKSLFKNTGFSIVEKQSSVKHKDGSPLLSWSAIRKNEKQKDAGITNKDRVSKRTTVKITIPLFSMHDAIEQAI